MKKNLTILVEGAVIAAVCMALSLIPIESPNAAFDLSLGLIPLSVYAVRRGLLPAIAVGLIWGLIHPLFGKAYILSIPQFILEYPFAFSFGGFFGLYAGKIRTRLAGRIPAGAAVTKLTGKPQKSPLFWIVLASVTACAARWIWHFIAGVLIWSSYAPEGMNPWFYSFLFNGASFLANTVMLIIVMAVLVKTAPRIFDPRNN